MTEWIERLADGLINKGANPENREVIIYGIEGAISEVFANIAAFGIAFLIGKPLEMLLWQIFWLPLRINIGGHHAKNHILCLIACTAMAIISVLVLPYIQNLWVFLVVEIVVTLIVVFFFAPYVHPNRLSSENHIKKIRKRGKIIAIIEIVLIILLYFVFPSWVAQIAALGMFIAVILCIVGFISDFFYNNK